MLWTSPAGEGWMILNSIQMHTFHILIDEWRGELISSSDIRGNRYYIRYWNAFLQQTGVQNKNNWKYVFLDEWRG